MSRNRKLNKLTWVEIEILQGLAIGLLFKQLEALMGYSKTTLCYHLRRIKAYFNAQTTTEAVANALRDGMIR